MNREEFDKRFDDEILKQINSIRVEKEHFVEELNKVGRDDPEKYKPIAKESYEFFCDYFRKIIEAENPLTALVIDHIRKTIHGFSGHNPAHTTVLIGTLLFAIDDNEELAWPLLFGFFLYKKFYEPDFPGIHPDTEITREDLAILFGVDYSKLGKRFEKSRDYIRAVYNTSILAMCKYPHNLYDSIGVIKFIPQYLLQELNEHADVRDLDDFLTNWLRVVDYCESSENPECMRILFAYNLFGLILYEDPENSGAYMMAYVGNPK